MTAVHRCGTCRWWKVPCNHPNPGTQSDHRRDGYGQCSKLWDTNLIFVYDDGHDGVEVGPCTHADFGCTLWEKAK